MGNPNHDPKNGQFTSGGGGGGTRGTRQARGNTQRLMPGGKLPGNQIKNPGQTLEKYLHDRRPLDQSSAEFHAANDHLFAPTTHVHHSSGSGGYGADGNMTIVRDVGRAAAIAHGTMGGRGVLSGSPAAADREYERRKRGGR